MESQQHLLVNVLGHAAGVLVFGQFLAFLLWRRSLNRRRAEWLSVLAGALALLWNLASLAALLLTERGAEAYRPVVAFAFGMLSLLPAVLLHLSAGGVFSGLIVFGYVLSGASILAHLLHLAFGEAIYRSLALTIITGGFSGLTVWIVLQMVRFSRGRSNREGPRLLAGMALFLFAISFTHFNGGQASVPWFSELLVHHAGIPLALVVLLQDHRFIFVDSLVRVLVRGGLALCLAFSLVAVAPRTTYAVGIVLVAAALLIFEPVSRSGQGLLGRLLFRRREINAFLQQLQDLPAGAPDEQSYLRRCGELLAEFFEAELIEVKAVPGELDLLLPTLASEVPSARELRAQGVEVIVPVRRQEGGTYYIFLGKRSGGRRYLSEDLQSLAQAAARLAQEASRIREAERLRLFAQAELKALQAQIHPHFLFNALNALYGLIPKELREARRMLLNLAEVLRYFLQGERTYIPLEEELRIVKAYLEIERLRLGDKLQVELAVDEGVLPTPIPVLCVQPLVENAVRHGIAARAQGGKVRLEVGRENGHLRVVVADTGPGFAWPGDVCRGAGVGLENVNRRLQLCYATSTGVQVQRADGWTTVSFSIPAAQEGRL
jgi:hypothetical protein